MVGAEQWSSSLSREEQLRLHFQVPGKCPATHRDLMVPSLPPDLLQTSTDPNFLWPSTDLGLGFSRDHGSKEFSWPQTSLLQQGLIQQRGRGWELGISQGRAARNGHKRANSYSLVTQAEPTELLWSLASLQNSARDASSSLYAPPPTTLNIYIYTHTYSLFFPPKPIKVLQAEALSGRRLALKRPMK